MSVIITLIIFTLIVVVHEGGHFFAAKKCGVFVEEFAVGMGPKLFGIKRGDTLYTVRLLPIGGFCRMSDEEPPVEGSGKIGFNRAKVWQRIIISVAGPVMNFILALLVLSFMALATGVSTNTVGSIMEGYPAQEAGLLAGDKIVAINGKAIHTRNDLDFYISEHRGEELEITVKRGSERVKTLLTPKLSEDGRYLMGITTEYKAPALDLGIYEDMDSFERASFFDCVYDGFYQMIYLVKITVIGVVRILSLNVSLNDISGPIGVTTVVGDVYEQTIKDGAIFTLLTMLNLAALLSANLGVINLVPIPALDGGRIFVYLVEIVRRKQLPPEKEGILNLIGFALVMGFGLIIAINDIIRLI